MAGGISVTKSGVKSVDELSAVIYDLSTTITAFKSWIAWEHTLRFKYRATPPTALLQVGKDLAILRHCIAMDRPETRSIPRWRSLSLGSESLQDLHDLRVVRLEAPIESDVLERVFSKKDHLNFLIRKAGRSMLLLVAVVGGIWLLSKAVPGGFIPDEDKGLLFVGVELPEGASLQRSDAVLKKAEQIVAETKGVRSVCAISGFNILTGLNMSNAALMYSR
jgi:AcrB/AcrD/AcrF family